MNLKKMLILIFVLILISLHCDTTEPPVDNLQPGRRDYVWTVDTLYSPNNTLYSIWGATPDDIWLGGKGGITNYDQLWHFDGVRWKPYENQIIETYPNCIFGFSKSDIWIGGNDGKIWHFDGNSWSQSFMYQTGSSYVDIVDISGKISNDIYAIGISAITSSFILHYDGISWREQFFTNNKIQFLQMRQENNRKFISGIKQTFSTEPDTFFFFEYNDVALTEILSKPLDESTYWASMNLVGNELFFLIGRNLNNYKNGVFTKTLTINEPNFNYQVYGRNEKDMFIIMRDGLAHYNGTNIEYLYQFSNTWMNLFKPLIFEKEIFFPIEDNLNNYKGILHGVLK
ncbi:MAG TPA: hypothetical protein VJ201_01980 [Candidatus Babeliales bacterium]|nr:hypothetical protein [Candidatus Babeliales bacterium]